MEIICDTNIWYRIGAKGIHQIKQYTGNDIKLYISHLSFFELISSNMINTDFEAFKWANYAIDKYAKILVPNDIEQVLLALDVQFIPKGNAYIIDNIRKICQTILEARTSADLNYEYEKLIEARRNATQNIIKHYSELVENLGRKNIITPEIIKARLTWSLMREVLFYIVKHRLIIKRGWYRLFNYKKYHSTLDLYLTCFSHFLYTCIKSKNTSQQIKIKSNDYVDFRNLLYCVNDRKYLTLEKSTSNRIGGILRKYGADYELENAEQIKQQYKSE